MSLDSYLWVLIKQYLWTFITSTPAKRNKSTGDFDLFDKIFLIRFQSVKEIVFLQKLNLLVTCKKTSNTLSLSIEKLSCIQSSNSNS